MRDAEVERAPEDRAAVRERPVVAEVLPEAERDAGQLQAAAADAAVRHALVARRGRRGSGRGRARGRTARREYRSVRARRPARGAARLRAPGGRSSAGRAPGCGPGGREFESRRSPSERQRADLTDRPAAARPGARGCHPASGTRARVRRRFSSSLPPRARRRLSVRRGSVLLDGRGCRRGVAALGRTAAPCLGYVVGLLTHAHSYGRWCERAYPCG